jgi:hypothetical protein
MTKVRLKRECSVFVNCVRYEYKEGWVEVDEKHLKELRKLGAVSAEKPQLEIEVKNGGNATLLESKRRGRSPILHASK